MEDQDIQQANTVSIDSAEIVTIKDAKELEKRRLILEKEATKQAVKDAKEKAKRAKRELKDFE